MQVPIFAKFEGILKYSRYYAYVEVGISKIGNCLKQSLKSIQTSYGVYALKQIN